MNQSYIKRIPKWFEEQKENDLVLSNDIDSLLSCAIINKVKGWKIRYFYDFYNVYKSNKITEENDRVWVDVAICNDEKAFDNHVSTMSRCDSYNRQMINPNLIYGVSRNNYTSKYAGSTALMLWSLYNLPLPDTEEGKMLLLCIDIAYKGHYDERYEAINTFYIKDMFGFDELIRVMNRHTKQEFDEMVGRFGLTQELYCEAGKINTALNLDRIEALLNIKLDVLEDDIFTVWKEFEVIEKDIPYATKTMDELGYFIFSLALTYKNSARYSREKIEKKEETDMDWLRRLNAVRKPKLIF